jgi:hypothetical protein
MALGVGDGDIDDGEARVDMEGGGRLAGWGLGAKDDERGKDDADGDEDSRAAE